MILSCDHSFHSVGIDLCSSHNLVSVAHQWSDGLDGAQAEKQRMTRQRSEMQGQLLGA